MFCNVITFSLNRYIGTNILKILLLAFCISISLGICLAQNTAILTGKSTAFKENDKVTIQSNTGYEDSAFINNCNFKFNIPATKAALYFIDFPTASKSIQNPVFMKADSKMAIELDSAYKNLEISGDQLALEQNNFWKQAIPISQKYSRLKHNLGKTNDSLKLMELNKALQNEITAFAISWVEQHRSSPFSVMVVRLFIAEHNIPGTEDTLGERYFDYLTPEAKENNFESEKLRTFFAKKNDKYADNLSIKDFNINNYIYLNDKKYSKIPLGSMAPDFYLKDTIGNAISLNNFKGKYLLIDFWASWCGPCRENNPSLKKIYKQYKGKGLQVLSISIDGNAQKWKKAIIEDKMNWRQGSELLGANSIAATGYAINAIPTYILIDPDQKIVVKSIGDIEFIREKLKEILF